MPFKNSYQFTIVIGNLTKDPEVYPIGNGQKAVLTVAVNKTWKDRNSGEKKEKGTFIRLHAYDFNANFASQYLKKGDSINATAEIANTSWKDQQGNQQYADELRVTQLTPLNNYGGNNRQNQSNNPQGQGYNNQQNQGNNPQGQGYNNQQNQGYNNQQNQGYNNAPHNPGASPDDGASPDGEFDMGDIPF